MAIQKQVLRLQVAVDDVLLVEVVERESDLSSIKLGNGVGEALHLSDGMFELNEPESSLT
jgi:hypothetical protein